MRKYYFYISLSLLVSLFIYLFYRIDQTNINIILSSIFQVDIHEIKEWLRFHLPLPNFVVYNIPEGLWIFSMTLLGSNLFLRFLGKKIHMIHFPISFALVLEVLQAFHITNGTFDVWDIIVSIIFAGSAHLFHLNTQKKLGKLPHHSRRVVAFIFVFSLIYLSDIDTLSLFF